MADEIDTPLDSGTDGDIPEQTDTAPDWDYYDPDEDQETEESAETEATDDGTESDDETQETEEADESDADETQDENADADAEESDEAVFELADGEKVTKDELIKGHLRQQDYTRKTMEVAERRKSVEAEAQRLNGITEAFIDHIVSLVPDEPDPSLALTNPNRYTAQKAQYDAAVAQVQKLVEIGGTAKTATDAMTQDAQREQVAQENQRLSELFPETATKEGREKFFNGAGEAAVQIGFSPEELSRTTDHRLFALAHWANVGMQAQKARETAKRKVEKAPPATPKRPGKTGVKSDQNRDAMRKLSKTGSIRDAIKVDFE